MRNDRFLVALAALVGAVLIVLAIVYFTVSAGSLPSILPGHVAAHQAGASHVHVKHGIAALLVGLVCFAFVWFRTGPKRAAAG